ncbi:hypothetical protein [Chamaesiphon minutus]|uniref:Uncharacterized protein n=1 Tax=Chamaesiphon minutus (strain ATCC 27169 / PCC 6605) TaxID=1173020 RepID=K9UE82_CHAP6|nr:hypothetical protein [Chamaesiphon minutus]AFY92948.1 hypothetical protein Cha6605_1832 [Chamaesiphon minutus PCC 6605]
MPPQQLELDLWQILAVAQAEPATVGFIELCGRLDGLNLVDGARAVGEIAEIYRSRAETILAEIATAYLPAKEPVLPDELWAHLYRQTFILRDEHLYLEVEQDYPHERQSVIKLGVEADEVATEAMMRAAVIGNAHEEEIELWASRIRGVMVECGEMLLVELQQKSGLNLVDLWLGLLLGNTGCSIHRQLSSEIEFSIDFYDQAGIWIVEYRANV